MRDLRDLIDGNESFNVALNKVIDTELDKILDTMIDNINELRDTFETMTMDEVIAFITIYKCNI